MYHQNLKTRVDHKDPKEQILKNPNNRQEHLKQMIQKIPKDESHETQSILYNDIRDSSQHSLFRFVQSELFLFPFLALRFPFSYMLYSYINPIKAIKKTKSMRAMTTGYAPP